MHRRRMGSSQEKIYPFRFHNWFIHDCHELYMTYQCESTFKYIINQKNYFLNSW